LRETEEGGGERERGGEMEREKERQTDRKKGILREKDRKKENFKVNLFERDGEGGREGEIDRQKKVIV